ncbi:hypothetical protein N9D31_03035, partial [Oligoflexaceae bacterium]|nr:hypothetical protein [Oligoflexaceae bacterium]
YAMKERFISLPDGKTATFHAEKSWQLPVGGTLVKNFYFDLVTKTGVKRQIVETRLLVRSENGFRGFSYAWNEKATDAILLEKKAQRNFTVKTPEGPKTIPYLYPSRRQCVLCHSPRGFGPLAFTAAQTNMTIKNSKGANVNQIHQLMRHGVFRKGQVPADLSSLTKLPNPKDTRESLVNRARSYLHSNCSHCHNQVGGTGRGAFDMRWRLSLAKSNLCKAKPLTGDLGIPGATILKAGDPSKSLLYLRSITKNPRYRMPNLGTHINDSYGHNLLKEWISNETCS